MTGCYIGLVRNCGYVGSLQSVNAAPGPLDLTAEAFGFAPIDHIRADEAASRADLIAELAAVERENLTLREALAAAEARLAAIFNEDIR